MESDFKKTKFTLDAIKVDSTNTNDDGITKVLGLVDQIENELDAIIIKKNEAKDEQQPGLGMNIDMLPEVVTRLEKCFDKVQQLQDVTMINNKALDVGFETQALSCHANRLSTAPAAFGKNSLAGMVFGIDLILEKILNYTSKNPETLLSCRLLNRACNEKICKMLNNIEKFPTIAVKFWYIETHEIYTNHHHGSLKSFGRLIESSKRIQEITGANYQFPCSKFIFKGRDDYRPTFPEFRGSYTPYTNDLKSFFQQHGSIVKSLSFYMNMDSNSIYHFVIDFIAKNDFIEIFEHISKNIEEINFPPLRGFGFQKYPIKDKQLHFPMLKTVKFDNEYEDSDENLLFF